MLSELDIFVNLPGFFRVEKSYMATGPLTNVVVYGVGAALHDQNGDPFGSVLWGHGTSLQEALEDWEIKKWKHVDQMESTMCPETMLPPFSRGD